jgi:2-polyprenyl-3-methyl-5-hydroxy-6-metoxy-1,4-benzoquinol methylase
LAGIASPIPGDRLHPWLKQVSSTYASGKSYQIYRGDPSGIGVTVPAPTPAELNDLYASTYDYGAHALIEREKRWRNRKLVDHLVAGARPSLDTVLDVGCMYGYLLEELRARGARAVHGIEIAEGPARVAEGKGFAIHQGTIEAYAASTPAGAFDAIFAQHVLEHVGDPLLFLRAALALLKPGGKLALVVPNVGSLSRRIFGTSWGWYQVPAHLFHFSARALVSLCQSACFVIDGQRTRGGDSLFLLMTLAHTVDRLLRPSAEQQPATLSPARKLIVRGASLFCRPYLYLCDEELVLIAAKPLAPAAVDRTSER